MADVQNQDENSVNTEITDESGDENVCIKLKSDCVQRKKFF